MSQASDLKDAPDQAVKDVMDAVQKGSESSGSLSSVELTQEDGSVLIVSSFRGGEPALEVRFDDVHLNQAPVLVPRPDDAAPPQGLGDDGVHRDENGNPVGDDA